MNSDNFMLIIDINYFQYSKCELFRQKQEVVKKKI